MSPHQMRYTFRLTELNPILRREVRGRWRRPITFIIIFIYAALLALMMGWVYSDYVERAALQQIAAPNVAPPGRRLFATMVWMQTLLWVVLAAVVAAPAISSERERGLFQALQLSPLTPRQIVMGKLLSALSFTGLMLLVPLPISALCFQLNGVSPAEFVLAFLLHASTVLSSAAIGICCSTTTRRSSTALIASVVISSIVGILPVTTARFGFDGSFMASVTTCIFFQMMVTSILLAMAAVAVRDSLPERGARDYLPLPLPGPPPLTPWESVPVATWSLVEPTPKPPPTAPPHAASQPAPRPAAPVRPPAVAMPIATMPVAPCGESALSRWEKGLLERLQFSNPITQREVRLRFRRSEAAGPPDTGGLGYVGTSLICGTFVAGLCLIAGSEFREFARWTGAFIWFMGVALSAAMMGSTAFTREREQGMLQPLLLTPLSPVEILLGKVGASLVLCGYYSTALLPGLLLFLVLRPLPTLTIILAVTVAAWCATAWGMLFSWFCRHTSIATGGAVTTVLFACVWGPRLFTYVLHKTKWGALIRRHPDYLFWRTVLDPGTELGFFLSGLLLAGAFLGLGLLSLGIIYPGLRPGVLEKDSRSILAMDLTQHFQ